MAINKPIPKRPRTVFSSGFWGSALWWKVSSSKFRLQNSKTEKKAEGLYHKTRSFVSASVNQKP